MQYLQGFSCFKISILEWRFSITFDYDYITNKNKKIPVSRVTGEFTRVPSAFLFLLKIGGNPTAPFNVKKKKPISLWEFIQIGGEY